MVGEQRYPRTFATEPAVSWIRRVTIIATGLLSVALLAGYPQLPDSMPTHFDLLGNADGYGPKWTMLVLVGLLSVLIFATAWLSARPQTFNYPIMITDENAQIVYREGERMMVWIAAALLLFYLGTAVSTIGGVGSPFFLVGVIGLALSVIRGIRRIFVTARG